MKIKNNPNQKLVCPLAIDMSAKDGTQHAEWTQRGKGCAHAWPDQADSIFKGMVIYKF